METNDLYRRIRYALQLDDRDSQRLMQLGGLTNTFESAWRKKSQEEGAIACPPAAIDALLAGAIVDKRGARDGATPHQPANNVDNNRIAKQLRIALQLRSEDIEKLVKAGGGSVTASEISAIFRNPGSRNFRQCGDQMLRWLLAGLAAKRR